MKIENYLEKDMKDVEEDPDSIYRNDLPKVVRLLISPHGSFGLCFGDGLGAEGLWVP